MTSNKAEAAAPQKPPASNRLLKFLFFLLVALLAIAAFYLKTRPLLKPKTVTLKEQSKISYQKQALNFYNKKKYFEAARLLSLHLKQKPQDTQARKMLAESYLQLNQFKQAVKQYQTVLSKTKDSQIAYQIAVLLKAQKEPNKAVGLLHRIKLNLANTVLVNAELAKTFQQAGKLEETEKLWQETVISLPDTDRYKATAFAELGDVYKKEGQLEKAKQAYTDGLKLEPENEYLRQQLSQLSANAAPTELETTLLKLPPERLNSRRLKLFGLTKTKLKEVEVALVNTSGLGWSGTSWETELKWHKLRLKLQGRYLWQAEVMLPSLNNESLTFLVRAIAADGSPDPKPLTFKLQVDNVPPAIQAVGLEKPGVYINQEKIKVISEVPEAAFMRLAPTKKLLKKTNWQKYSSLASYRLASGDGQKSFWIAFADAFGNEVHKKLTVILDTAAPVIHKLTPGEKATAVDVQAKIKVQFIEGSGLDLTSLSSGKPFYLLNSKGQEVPATIDYYQGSQTVVLTPKQPLEKGQLYTAFLTPDLKDLAGNSLENSFSWSFEAVASTPPETQLLTQLPPVVTGKTVTIEGIASHPEGVKKVLLTLQNQEGKFWQDKTATWTTEPVEQEVALKSLKKKEVSFAIKMLLPSLDSETVTVKLAAVNAYDAVDPTPVTQTVAIDNQPPVVEKVTLISGGQVTATTTVDLDFSQIKNAAFVRLADSLSKLKTAQYQTFNPTMNFTLSDRQGLKTVYFQFKDKAGNETKADKKSALKIYYDKEGPKVKATFPDKDAVNVSTSVMITANFNELALDASTVNERTFLLFNVNDETVPAQVRYDTLSRTATLTPLEDLNFGAKYTVKLSGEIKDKVGNSLAKEYTWQFQTIGLSTHPPGAPQQVKVVATDKANLISWQPVLPATDKGQDFNPPALGGYNIYRSLNANGPFEQLNTVPITSTSYLDDSFDRPAIYFYLVKAVDGGGQESLEGKPQPSELTEIKKVVKKESSTTIMAANGLIELSLPKVSWTRRLSLKAFPFNKAKAQDLPSSYELPAFGQFYQLTVDRALGSARLKLKLAGDGQGAKIVQKTEKGWHLLTEGRYDYDPFTQTLVYEPLTEGGLLAVVNSFDLTPPPAPSQFSADFKKAQVQLNWQKVVDFDSGISGYKISKTARQATSLTNEVLADTSAAMVVDLPAQASSFLDPDVKADFTYFYSLTAVNGSGLESSATTVQIEVPANLSWQHRPQIKTSWSCRDCHLAKGKLSKKVAVCYTCHDGSGSKLIVQGYTAKISYYCQRCHSLSKKDLNKYTALAAKQNIIGFSCQDCHQKRLKRRLLKPTTKGHQDCRSCHSLHRPGGKKNLYLVNPANSLKNWQKSETRFCTSCHQAKKRLSYQDVDNVFRPAPVVFSNTVKWPFFTGWDKTLFLKSKHARFSSCFTCHRIHIDSPNLLVFKQGNKYVKLPPGAEGDFVCYQCHRLNGWPKAKDILSLQVKTAGHLNQSFNLHSNKEDTSDITLNRHASCADCHNVHVLTSEKRLGFSNRVSGALAGVRGVDFSTEKAGVTPAPFPIKLAQFEYQICLKCHSWTSNSQTSKLVLDFSRGNASFHPVIRTGKNKGIKKESFVNGWTSLATMYCSDCHSNDSTQQASGPHASNNKYLLKLPYKESTSSNQGELCFLCHNQKVYQDGESGSRFTEPNGHKTHSEKGVKCYQCHETHGSAFQPHLMKIATETTGLVMFTHDSTGGSCLATCHQDPSKVAVYKHAYK